MFVVVGCWFSCRAKMLDNEDHHHKKGVDIYDERGVLTLRSTEKAAKQCQKGCGIPELVNQNYNFIYCNYRKGDLYLGEDL